MRKFSFIILIIIFSSITFAEYIDVGEIFSPDNINLDYKVKTGFTCNNMTVTSDIINITGGTYEGVYDWSFVNLSFQPDTGYQNETYICQMYMNGTNNYTISYSIINATSPNTIMKTGSVNCSPNTLCNLTTITDPYINNLENYSCLSTLQEAPFNITYNSNDAIYSSNNLTIINAPLILVNNTPTNLTLNYSEGDTINFDIETNDGDNNTPLYQWFVDGVLEAITKIFNYFIEYDTVTYLNDSTIQNITIIVNDTDGSIITQTWSLGVNNTNLPPNITNFYQTPTNISWLNNTIYAICVVDDEDIDSENLSVTIEYRKPSSSTWLNMTEYYNNSDTWISNYTTSINYSLVGTFDFRCRVSDVGGETSSYHTDLDTVNVYYTNITPTTPTSITPFSGIYDTSIPVTCSGSTDFNSDPIYYDIQAIYQDVLNQTTNWTNLTTTDSDGFLNWYVLNLPIQDGIQFRCRATDLNNYSDWFYSNSSLQIIHGSKVELFEIGYDLKYANEYLIYNIYCDTQGMTNSYIYETWADCNGDGKWDYTFIYNNSINLYNETPTESSNPFTCIYSEPSNYTLSVGCVTKRINESLPWDKEFCKNIRDSDSLCNYKKYYGVEVIEP